VQRTCLAWDLVAAVNLWLRTANDWPSYGPGRTLSVAAISAAAAGPTSPVSCQTMIYTTAPHLDDATLDRLMRLSRSADPPPRRSMIEGRDHMSGDSFIMIGPGDDRREDLYLFT
jgi:hypothetical protein